MDQMERAEMNALRERNRFLQRQNGRLRDVAVHECSICRCCEDRARLVTRALGRQLLTTRAEGRSDV